MNWQRRIRFVAASLIVFAWVFVEFRYGRIRDPTLELRLIVLCSVIYLFGESTVDYALAIMDRDESGDGSGNSTNS